MSISNEPLYSLIYSSVAVKAMSKEELLELLHHSRSFNTANGITGMLIYHKQLFMQVLEGEKSTVWNLYNQKIKNDQRHAMVWTYLFEPLKDREFGDWSMGFHDLGDYNLKEIEGFSDFLEKGFSQEALKQNSSKAKELLLLFRDFDRSYMAA